MKFDDLNPLRSSDTEEIVTPENGPKSIGTFKKRAPDPLVDLDPLSRSGPLFADLNPPENKCSFD